MKLPVLSGREVVKALLRTGFTLVGRKGSHVRLNKQFAGKTLVLVVPDHKELAVGTLNDIIRRSGLTREEFISLLK